MRGRFKTGDYKSCLLCKKYFYCRPSLFKSSKFCSRNCLAKWRYKNGYSEKLNKGFKHTIKINRKISKTLKERYKKIDHHNKGLAPWNKGKKLHYDVWNKGKNFIQCSGEKHHNWKGGKTSKSEKIRKSIEYKKWREKVFKRDDWTCQECGQRGGKLTAHHIKSFRNFPKLVFKISNGKTLCTNCHLKTDNYAEKAILNKDI